MITNRKLTVIPVAILASTLLLNFGCSKTGGKSNSVPLGTLEDPLTPELLDAEFGKGLEAVNDGYVGKTLIVQGVIIGIDGSPGEIILGAKGDRPFEFPGISCKPKPTSMAEFSSLKLGDGVIVQGAGKFVGKQGKFIFLDDCTLLKKLGKPAATNLQTTSSK